MRHSPDTLRSADDGVIAELQQINDQWVLEYNTDQHVAFPAHQHTSRSVRPPRKGTAMRWHKRMGHPGPNAIEHLVQQSQGVRLQGITTVQCDACGRSKIRRQIRRTPRTNDEGPGERVAIDFHSYEEGSVSKEKSQMLIYDRFSGLMWYFYFTDHRPARTRNGQSHAQHDTRNRDMDSLTRTAYGQHPRKSRD
jgi:hypothetical protein